jgi:hypothetical protein
MARRRLAGAPLSPTFSHNWPQYRPIAPPYASGASRPSHQYPCPMRVVVARKRLLSLTPIKRKNSQADGGSQAALQPAGLGPRRTNRLIEIFEPVQFSGLRMVLSPTLVTHFERRLCAMLAPSDGKTKRGGRRGWGLGTRDSGRWTMSGEGASVDGHGPEQSCIPRPRQLNP